MHRLWQLPVLLSPWQRCCRREPARTGPLPRVAVMHSKMPFIDSCLMLAGGCTIMAILAWVQVEQITYQGPATGEATAMSTLLMSSKPTCFPACSASLYVLISCKAPQLQISKHPPIHMLCIDQCSMSFQECLKQTSQNSIPGPLNLYLHSGQNIRCAPQI